MDGKTVQSAGWRCLSCPIGLWCAFPGCDHGRRHLPDERILIRYGDIQTFPTLWPVDQQNAAGIYHSRAGPGHFSHRVAHRPLFRRVPEHAHASRYVAADPPSAGAVVGSRDRMGDGVEHWQYHHLFPCTFPGNCGLYAGVGAGAHPRGRPPHLANHTGRFAGHADCVCAPKHGSGSSVCHPVHLLGPRSKTRLLCPDSCRCGFHRFSPALLAQDPYPVGKVFARPFE